MTSSSLQAEPEKWTEKINALAAELPESAWTSEPAAEDGLQEGYAWLRHLPGEAQHAYRFAVVRRQAAGEMFWRYACLVGDDRIEQAARRGPLHPHANHSPSTSTLPPLQVQSLMFGERT